MHPHTPAQNPSFSVVAHNPGQRARCIGPFRSPDIAAEVAATCTEQSIWISRQFVDDDRLPGVKRPEFVARATFAAPSSEADPEFQPTLTVELGRFTSQHEADAAVAVALAHPACVAARARLEEATCHG